MKILNIVTAVSLLAGFTVTTTAFAFAEKNKPDTENQIACDLDANKEIPHMYVDYEVNENGETYGITPDSVYVGDYPDLIAAVGDNGVCGYVRNSEVIGETPSCPEEAVKMMEENKKNGNPKRVINVYESDGITVVDTLTSD